MNASRNSLTTGLVGLFLALAGTNGESVRAACVNANALPAGSGLNFVNIPPVRVVCAVDPSTGTYSTLSVTDCDSDGDNDIAVAWSELGIPQPAKIRFAPVCAGNPPRAVEIAFEQGVDTVVWRAISPAAGVVGTQTSSGSGAHVVSFNHPAGIGTVLIGGAEICLQEICFWCAQEPQFLRGDANNDASIDLGDGVFILMYLFQRGPQPPCLDAADANDNGTVDIADAIHVLAYLFNNGPPPVGGGKITVDETIDNLGCRTSSAFDDPIPIEEFALLAMPGDDVPPSISLPETPTHLTLHLSAERPRILAPPEADGVIIRESKHPAGERPLATIATAGKPDIARRVVNVLLPFDADLSTLSLAAGAVDPHPVPQPFSVRPVGRTAFYDEERMSVQTDEPEEGKLDAEGRDTTVYGRDMLWPEDVISVAGFGAHRQYRYVQLLFSPYQWNPATGELFELHGLTLTLTWERTTIDTATALDHLSDPVTDSMTATYFTNWREAHEWHELSFGFLREGVYDYVIVTTQDIEADSTELDDFIDHKESQGYSVASITVETIEYVYPETERADSIRAFLKDKYSAWGIEYVLLIGDPDPYNQYEGAADDVGSVPMKMAWPRGDGVVGTEDDGSPDYGYCPTDHYYADLSGDWDVDGDGYAGSSDDYTITMVDLGGGLEAPMPDYGYDFSMEVLVGRIPYDDITKIDTVLARVIRYQENADSPSSGRSRAYVACSFLKSNTDGAYLGRQLHNDVLDPYGLTTHTFYQAASTFASTHVLQDTALIDEWQNRSAGLVLWYGHGGSTSSSIGYSEDGHDYHDGTIMDTASAPTLVKGPNPFMFQGSCSNARPEVSENLAHTMLYETAIATVAGTRKSWLGEAQTEFGDEELIGDLAYRYLSWVVKGTDAGYALKRMRADCVPENTKRKHNLMTYNLYGDPAGTYEY